MTDDFAEPEGTAGTRAYVMAERMLVLLPQAYDEATDPEERAALSRAGEHLRDMRDHIVRALTPEERAEAVRQQPLPNRKADA